MGKKDNFTKLVLTRNLFIAIFLGSLLVFLFKTDYLLGISLVSILGGYLFHLKIQEVLIGEKTALKKRQWEIEKRQMEAEQKERDNA